MEINRFKKQHVEPQYVNIEDSIVSYNKDWEQLFNDIVKNPTPEGRLKYQFSFGSIDLHKFEEYIKATLLLKNIDVLLKYKASRLENKIKGYGKFERR